MKKQNRFDHFFFASILLTIIILAIYYLLRFDFVDLKINVLDLTLTTPALLFPAISLFLLADTSRFLALAQLIRKLADEYRNNGTAHVLSQIDNLNIRLILIRDMQGLALLSFFSCVISMFFIFAHLPLAGEITFNASLLFFISSIIISAREIQISVDALTIEIDTAILSRVKKK